MPWSPDAGASEEPSVSWFVTPDQQDFRGGSHECPRLVAESWQEGKKHSMERAVRITSVEGTRVSVSCNSSGKASVEQR